MDSSKLSMVTGAFSFTGKYIAKRLLSIGEGVRTLTGHPGIENPFDRQVEAFLYNFDKQEKLVDSLRGVDVLYNTYWIRFPYKELTFDQAINNSKILIEAAQKAGVKRIVYISIANADENSLFAYFKGKRTVERFIQQSDFSYAIIRPTMIFGKGDILVNNIAWHLRKFPVFTLFGKGDYRVQPIYVEDLAEFAIDAAQKDEDIIIDAAGPETFTFSDLVHLIKEKVKSKAKIIHLPPRMPLIFSRIVGWFVNDIVLTRDEVEGLMRELLYSREPLRGKTRFSHWLEENSESVGKRYASELKRHYFSSEK